MGLPWLRKAFLDDPTPIILGAFGLFICMWFGAYFTSEPVAAVDLPGHIRAIEGLRDNWNWWRGSPAFYDTSCFTGYPAFQFYAFLSHVLCAALSIPLSLFSSEPVRLCSHIMLVASLALLPVSMMRASRPLVRELFQDQPELEKQYRWVLALCTCALSFWFINHDHSWVGATAVLHVGLFSQAFGWHLLLLHFALMVELLQDGGRTKRIAVAITFALLFMTHTMTAVFSAYLVLLSTLWYAHKRKELVLSHLMAAGLCAFWALPMVAYLNAYTPLDIHRPTADDFLQLYFRYPVYALLRSMWSWLHGTFEPLNPTEIAVAGLFVVLFCSKQKRKCPTLITFLVFSCIGLVIMASGFSATSVRFGFHWYRFFGYLFLFFTLLVSVVPLFIIRSAHEMKNPVRWSVMARNVVALSAVGCLVGNALLPHRDRDRIIKSRAPDFLAKEQAVLEHFRQMGDKGRVITEYFSDYDKYPFLSCHYISAHLLRDAGFEPINGLYIQASLAYHFQMGSAYQLKAHSYICQSLFPEIADLSDDDRIQQLQGLGITHAIGKTGSEFTEKVKKYAVEEPKVIGPYTIMKLLAEHPPMVRPVAKRLVAYMDLTGNLPFKFMELFFYGKSALNKSFEVLELKNGDVLPPQTDVLIINGHPSEVRDQTDTLKQQLGRELAVVPLQYQQYYVTRHYSVQYQHNPELDDFRDVAEYFEKKVMLRDQMARFATPVSPVGTQTPVTMTWDRDKQGFTLEGLQPGLMYRINYSHFPYWRSDDGRVLRGSQERIFFVADRTTARFSWRPYATSSWWLGWFFTLLTIAQVVRMWRKQRAARPVSISTAPAPVPPTTF